MIEREESMVDRVAEALRAHADDREDAPPGFWQSYARVAIEAMREPTTEQLRGLIRHRGYDPDAKETALDTLGQFDIMTMGTYVQAYTAMIDAALKESS